MSENAIVHAPMGKPQLKRQKQSVDSLDLENEVEGVSVGGDDDRRLSSASSDSQKSASKKPASMNEIQDLYSALQDLVKTNVSTTPLPERRAKVLAVSSPSGSPRLGERTLTVPERELRKLSSRISPSSSFEKESSMSPEDLTLTKKHRRGVSTGTMEAVANLMRISPFPSRKFSHDTENTSNTNNKDNKKSSAKNGTSSGGKKERSISTGDQKKWKGARLFKRLRSKSNADLSEDDRFEKVSSTDDEDCVREKNRRRSEADALRVQRSRDKGLTPPQRKSLQEDSSKDIEQLVSSLNLKANRKPNKINQNNSNNFLQTPSTSSTAHISENPVNELNKLESWFENALTSKKYVVNDGSTSSDAASPKVPNQRFRRKIGGKVVRRASSNTATSQRIKEERRVRLNKSSKSFDATNGLVHAKSTPDLSMAYLNQDDDDEETDLSFTDNNSPSENKTSEESLQDKKTQRERRLTGRLPDSPVFYVPKTSDNTNDISTQVKPLLRKHSEAPMFYTKEEETKNTKNLLSPHSPISQNENNRRQSLGGSSPTHDKNFKNTRPKSMFIYSDQDLIIDDVLMTSSEDVNGRKTSIDSNANNLCRGKIINTAPHRLSLCDLSNTTVTIGGQDRTLWDKFRKVTSSKKTKACKYT